MRLGWEGRDVLVAESGYVEVRTFEAEVFGSRCNVMFGVEGLVLRDEDLLRFRCGWGRFFGCLRRVNSELSRT